MEGINEIIKSLQYAALGWVVIMMLTSILHKYKYHKLDRYLCLKCITFWLTLAISQSILIAAVASLLAHLMDKYINNTTTIL